MNDKIKINLQIADSYYPITINRDEEELMREAAKQVNINEGLLDMEIYLPVMIKAWNLRN